MDHPVFVAAAATTAVIWAAGAAVTYRALRSNITTRVQFVGALLVAAVWPISWICAIALTVADHLGEERRRGRYRR